jgi:iron complex transport system substrate-binding protein
VMNKSLKLWLSLVMAVVLAFGLAACGSGNAGGGAAADDGINSGAGAAQGETDVPEDNSAEAAQTQYPLTVTDASGKEMTFAKEPERIVSLAPSETEVLFALGLGDKVVGVDDWSDYPEEAKSKTKIGGLEANSEVILEANPDLIVGGVSVNGATVDQLRELGLTVFAGESKTIDEVIAHIEQIGQITNRSAEAAEVIAQMKAERQSVLDAVKDLADEEKRSVYIEFSPGWTVGKGEFMDELITLAGGVNIADQEGWYEINEEKVIEQNPAVILFSKNVEGLEAAIKARSGWQQIDAIVNNRVAALDDNLISRPGPRVTQGLIEIAKAIYPERFE